MASNYVQLNWLEPSWDDDQVGALSSLERRQRKAAEKQDVLAFYSSLGFVFFIVTGLLVWSEVYACATSPSKALTGAFLLEVWRSAGVAFSQLKDLYKEVGDIVWTWIAVVYGHDFAQRGVKVSDGAASLLASGLFYLAMMLSGTIMYSTYPHVTHAPVRTATYSTLAAGVLFGAPPLYALAMSRLCTTCSPESVALLALAFGALMCIASLRMTRSISGRLGRGDSSQPAASRQRSSPAARRQTAAAGSCSGQGGSSGSAVSSGGGAGNSGGAGHGGHKRNGAASQHAYSRASSSGRSGGGGSAAAAGDGAHSPAIRSGSYCSLSAPAHTAGSHWFAAGGGGGGGGGDPVGAPAGPGRSSGGVGGGGGGGSLETSSSYQQQPGLMAVQAAGCRAGPPGASHPSSFDPGAAVRPSGGGTPRNATGVGTSANNMNTSSSSSAAAAAKSSSNNKQQQRQHGGGTAGAGDGVAAGGKAKPTTTAPASTSATGPTRAAPDPTSLPATSSSSGGGSSKHAAAPQPPPAKLPDPVAAPSSSSTSSKKKGPSASTSASTSAAATSAAATSFPGSARHLPTTSPTATSMSGAAASASVAAGGRSRTDAGGSKPSTAAVLPGGGKSVPGAATSASTPIVASSIVASGGGLLARLTATVTSAAAAAPVLSNRAAKKAASGARKQQSQPPPQYIIVPPPPPPPRKPPAVAAEAPAATAAPSAPAAQPVRNAWLSPNPVIKSAAGVSKGAKGPVVARPQTAATAAAAAPPLSSVTRSGGGAPIGNSAPPTPPPPRSASCGGGTTADPPVVSNHSSGTTCTSAFGDPVAPPPMATAAAAAVGEPVAMAAVHTAAMALGVPAGAFLPPMAHQQQLRNQRHDSLVSATIVTTDPSVGPLVAHKHASGDLDIASMAANYCPYPSSMLPPVALAAVATGEPDSDSFSFFSIPPPVVISGGALDPAAAMADVDGASHAAHMLYGAYGATDFSALSSFAADPVWSPNVPTIFAPATGLGAGAGGAPRVPPPGFPSHAYGGAFASGPIHGGAWAQQPAAAADVAHDVRSGPVPPLLPAGESGVLASLGFVDDGGADSSSGGGEDAAGSCTICWSAPRQVGFLHGKTSHLCVCRRCAAQLREGVHRCPMCRQLIERIIDIF